MHHWTTICITALKEQENVLTTYKALTKGLKEDNIYVDDDCILANHTEKHNKIALQDTPENTLLIVLGGDGSMLHYVNWSIEKKGILLGINHGHTGFLTAINHNQIESLIEALNKKKIMLQKRTTITLNENHHALNEITLHRSQTPQSLKFQLQINDNTLGAYCADGVIISTPTGSTAYNLSAGGPIVHSACDNILISFICPHQLGHQSIVLPKNAKITVSILSKNHNAQITIDGKQQQIENKINIASSQKTVTMAFLTDYDFMDHMQKKFDNASSVKEI